NRASEPISSEALPIQRLYCLRGYNASETELLQKLRCFRG
ncbi:hypothetical protein A2U01_0100402, partial [Trifolium medium]|nr:hypothetical protein [Trifolium medium]